MSPEAQRRIHASLRFGQGGGGGECRLPSCLPCAINIDDVLGSGVKIALLGELLGEQHDFSEPGFNRRRLFCRCVNSD